MKANISTSSKCKERKDSVYRSSFRNGRVFAHLNAGIAGFLRDGARGLYPGDWLYNK